MADPVADLPMQVVGRSVAKLTRTTNKDRYLAVPQ